MSLRILLAGGGSGGHVYPLVSVTQELKSQAAAKGIELELLVLGDGVYLQKAVKELNLPYKRIVSGKVRRYRSILNLLDILKLPIGFIQSLWHLFWFMPDIVFAKGGYASVLPALAARLYAIDLYIHETDSIPGLANKILAKLGPREIFAAFPGTEKYFPNHKVTVVGNPVRSSLFKGNRVTALEKFGFSENLKTILIIGGSQGAKAINDKVLEMLVNLVDKYQLIHQCGEIQYQTVNAEVERLKKEGQGSYGDLIASRYRLYPFLDESDLAQAYSLCDVVISRAGGILFEIAMTGKPVIVIPIADSPADHQLSNAEIFVQYGAVIIEEENLTPHILLNQIEDILRPDQYEAVSKKIKSFAVSDSAQKIAQVLLTTK